MSTEGAILELSCPGCLGDIEVNITTLADVSCPNCNKSYSVEFDRFFDATYWLEPIEDRILEENFLTIDTLYRMVYNGIDGRNI